MSSTNQIVLIGRVANDIPTDVKHLAGGQTVAEVRLTVNRPNKDQNGENVADWIPCKFWNRQAEILSEYVKKDDLLSIVGTLQIDTWENNGEKHQRYYINGENFQMLNKKG